MSIRLQPRELEIPKSDPFENDLLNRREQVEIVERLIGNIEGPCVLALDAGWGYGKTTFLKMLAQHLRNRKVPVAIFNAWEKDHTNDLRAALASELHVTLKEVVPDHARRFQRLTSKLTQLTSFVEDGFQRHREAEDAIKEFKETFGKATMTSFDFRRSPLVIMIDELDRYQPSYAIEILKVVKHLFFAEHVVFLLAVNCRQLENSVSTLYGISHDTADCLRKFIDVDIRLADTDRKEFIEARLIAVGIEQDSSALPEWLKNLLKTFLGARCLSIRAVDQAIHQYALMSAVLSPSAANQDWGMVLALLLRNFSADLYRRFASLEIDDCELVERFFETTALRSLRDTADAHLFEALVMHACRELQFFDENGEIRLSQSPDLQAQASTYLIECEDTDVLKTPLQKKYNKIANADPENGAHREREVLAWDQYLHDELLRPRRLISYRHAMKCLDFQSPDYLDRDQPS